MRIRNGRFAIPDACVFWPAEAVPPAMERCPLSSVREKMQAYAGFGVPHVWLLDPRRKEMFELRDGLREVKLLKVEELGLTVTKADVYE